jgi:hypothetical protein
MIYRSSVKHAFEFVPYTLFYRTSEEFFLSPGREPVDPFVSWATRFIPGLFSDVLPEMRACPPSTPRRLFGTLACPIETAPTFRVAYMRGIPLLLEFQADAH